MEKHGFVVLTETGAIRDAYLEFMELLKAFFDGGSGWKEAFKGRVHFNERGIPMWHTGYEKCGNVREVFRAPALAFPPSSQRQPWPCPRLHRAWLAMVRLLQRVCHRALTLTLGRPVLGAPPAKAKKSRSTNRQEGASQEAVDKLLCERCPVCGSSLREGQEPEKGNAAAAVRGDKGGGSSTDGMDGGACHRQRFVCSEIQDETGDGCSRDSCDDDSHDDFSVSYALRYPNEFADPALEQEDLTVGEHVDPSLFVAEPCCGVEGLEICDRASGSWLPVEAVCAGLGSDGGRSLAAAEGRELILFGGKALERATEGRVLGAPHRVRRGDLGRRHCFIYEQKYAEFFPPPALD
ncbi:unnamed protein product [Ectocarpus sp. 12 AP-2014]